MTALTFYFDPNCPFTWITSRWFVEATDRAGVGVTWRAFPLSLVNAGSEIPEEYLGPLRASDRMLRVVESLAAEGRHEDAGRFYTEYGTRRWVEGAEADDTLALAAGAAAEVDDVAARLDDTAADERVRAAFDEARALVGDEVGTPVVRLDGTDRAMFGPVVSPAPRGDDADALLEAFLTLLQVPGVYEVKRTRSGDLDFG